jgi:hypothetical protein
MRSEFSPPQAARLQLGNSMLGCGQQRQFGATPDRKIGRPMPAVRSAPDVSPDRLIPLIFA